MVGAKSKPSVLHGTGKFGGDDAALFMFRAGQLHCLYHKPNQPRNSHFFEYKSWELLNVVHFRFYSFVASARKASNIMKSQLELLASISPTYTASTIKCWKSSRTGLQVVHIDHASPMVHGYFAVASEIDNDSGAPHTLEHLVFMGSNKYPYKGLLDQLGNKLLSSTNAWTATDQTVYTLTSAGWEGFSSLLPVYLDHVFHPTLTDAACLTEVYHIDGQGKEKGVVFSEMQGTENTSTSLMAFSAAKTRYAPKSGFSSETGGLTSNLRNLTNQEIRDFHQLRYRPDNLCIVITGKVDEGELIKIVSDFDSGLKVPTKIGYKRPFVDSPPDPLLDGPVTKVVEFPDVDESSSEILLNWIGPHNSDIVGVAALEVFGRYLTHESTGILSQLLVETEDPLATYISTDTDDYIFSSFNLWLSGVPTSKTEQARQTTLREIKEYQADASKINLELLRECIETHKDLLVQYIENDPSTLAQVAINSFVYGSTDGSDLVRSTKSLEEYDELLSWDADVWARFVKKYFTSTPEIAIIGIPSETFYNQLKKEKKERLASIKEKYGAEGLKELGTKLEKAQVADDKVVPQKVFDSFKSPNPANIKYNKTDLGLAGKALNSGLTPEPTLQRLLDQNGASDKDLGLYVTFDNYKSGFVNIIIEFSTSDIGENLLPYIGLFFDEIFALPMIIDGVTWSYQDVAQQINRETLYAYFSAPGKLQDTVRITVTAKTANYGIAVEWIQRAMWSTVFNDEERLRSIVQRAINSLPEYKRDENAVLNALICRETLTEHSLKRSSKILLVEDFYRKVWEAFDNDSKDSFRKIVEDLESLKKALFTTNNMRIFVHGSIEQLDRPVSVWKEFEETAKHQGFSGSTEELLPLPQPGTFLSENGSHLGKNAWLCPMPATESSFLKISAKGPFKFTDECIPGLIVAMSYLEAVEGPFWRAIRGSGMAYGVDMMHDIEFGKVSFSVYRGADPVGCLKEAKKIVLDLADGKVDFDEESLQGAISSKVNMLVSALESNSNTSERKFLDFILRQSGPNELLNMINRIHDVTISDLKELFPKYLKPIFHPDTSSVFAAMNPSMIENVETYLKEEGWNVNITSVTTLESDDEYSNESTDEVDSESELDSNDDSDCDSDSDS